MKKEIPKPIINQELIDYLDSIFPEKSADLKDTEKEVYFKGGQRSVVNHLINQKQIQEVMMIYQNLQLIHLKKII